jgi:hypothetical protein
MRGKIHRTTNLAGEMVCPECFLGVEELESPEERFSLLLSGYCIDCVPDDVADELSESRCVYRGEIIPMDPYESYWGACIGAAGDDVSIPTAVYILKK